MLESSWYLLYYTNSNDSFYGNTCRDLWFTAVARTDVGYVLWTNNLQSVPSSLASAIKSDIFSIDGNSQYYEPISCRS